MTVSAFTDRRFESAAMPNKLVDIPDSELGL